MAKVTFHLKHNKSEKYPNRSEATPLIMVLRFGEERIRFYPGEKVPPKFWLEKECRARRTIQFEEGENINTRLDTIEKKVLNAFRDHLNSNGAPVISKLKEEIGNIVRPHPVEEPEKLTFVKTIEEYKTSTNKSARTLLSYGTTLNILKKYEEDKNTTLSFEDITLGFYEDFTKYLETVQREEKEKIIVGYAKNTIADHIKKIKVFMNYANDKGYTTNTTHLHRKFRKNEETPETIYLNSDELNTLYNKDLTSKPKLDRVRDLFIIACHTGLRFSDLSQLTLEKFIKNGEQLKIKTVKTGEIVIIPLHWTIKEIIQKYNGDLPRIISNQKMNEYLKDLGKEVGLNDKSSLHRTQGGLSYESTKQKWELITVHTARRSFATNMYLANVPTISIMKITGHKTERAFMKYIKITQEQNADKLSTHPYFIKPLSVVVNQ